MRRNIARMQSRMDALDVRFRPHVKTSKCPEVVRGQIAAGARGITVSTLKEAERFLAEGVTEVRAGVSVFFDRVMAGIGVLHWIGEASVDLVRRFPVGSQLRIVPNHACDTGAQFDGYAVLWAAGPLAQWPSFSGW